ncbi:MAG: hypothetical protein P1S60_20815, partial [Anaerolineae bacterium]|nr:hypothetical protein [Anaerolineae bacterium]
MIIVSAAMVKSGSGWYYNMTNDLMVVGGHQDARYVRDKYHLNSIMRYSNCNIEYPILPIMMMLLIPHMQGHTFAVKTHQAPTWTVKY